MTTFLKELRSNGKPNEQVALANLRPGDKLVNAQREPVKAKAAQGHAVGRGKLVKVKWQEVHRKEKVRMHVTADQPLHIVICHGAMPAPIPLSGQSDWGVQWLANKPFSLAKEADEDRCGGLDLPP